MGSVFFMAQHIYFHIAAASLIKRWVAPSVGAAQDETRAKRHCQEVYGPGVWGHCLHVAREMCLRREKMAAYTGNDSLDIHPGRFAFGRRPSVFWANVMLFFFFFLLHVNLSCQGYRVGQRERWVFLVCCSLREIIPVAVVKNVDCFLMLIMCNTHEKPSAPGWLETSTCL